VSMAVLILLLLVGGVTAWQAERINTGWPPRVALATVCIALLYLLKIAAGLSAQSFELVPDPADGSSWLLHLKLAWIPRFGINFELAMDGLSLLLVTLTLLLGLIAIASSWSEIDFKPGLFQANLLWTLAGVCGVFLAVDLFLFFLFWEVMLIPMYLLIAIWGHENSGYASMKYFIYTHFSGLLMLL
jgi:NADH-quinone oxidoreductase subunit M